MKPEAIETILKLFCEPRGLDASRLSGGLREAISALAAPFLLLVECLDPAGISESKDPVDGLVLTLGRRTYDCMSGTLGLLTIGHLQEAEALSRTVLEGTTTLLYILQRDSGKRLAAWFRAYITQESKQNRLWRDDLVGIPESLRADHMARIEDKTEVLAHYQAFVEHFAQQIGIQDTSGLHWPDLYQRMAALGNSLEYRTVYAALCSQAHHDAEDILNDFIAGSVTDDDQLQARTKRERDAFSVYMVLYALKCFLDCMEALGNRFHFASVVMTSKDSRIAIEQALRSVIHELENGLFPEEWQAKN